MTPQDLELLLKNRFGPMVELRIERDEDGGIDVKARFEVTVGGRFPTAEEGYEHIFKEVKYINKEESSLTALDEEDKKVIADAVEASISGELEVGDREFALLAIIDAAYGAHAIHADFKSKKETIDG